MKDAVKCVAPGGVLMVIDGDMVTYKADQITIQPVAGSRDPDGSWLGRYFYGEFIFLAHSFKPLMGSKEGLAAQKAQQHPGDWDGARDLLDNGLWDIPGFDSDHCAAGVIYNPIGDWPQGNT